MTSLNKLKAVLYVIEERFVDIINSSLKESYCLEGWKTFTIIPISKIEKTKKASKYRPINMLHINMLYLRKC